MKEESTTYWTVADTKDTTGVNLIFFSDVKRTEKNTENVLMNLKIKLRIENKQKTQRLNLLIFQVKLNFLS